MAAKVYYEVHCPIHGKATKEDSPGHYRVVVPAPRSRSESKNGGCPLCKKE